ncbi:LytR C-terminal domain-containing protein, partial [candidate division KSB1 bacterium]|nr:LytR C-terminal domain-containing protein [candidate division KSB1 bacterium]
MKNKSLGNRRINYSRSKPQNKTSRKTSRKAGQSLSAFKYRVKLTIIWILLAVNVILVSSLVQRLIAQGPDKPHVYKGVTLTIEILNGCGKTGLAQSFADYLQRKGCQIARVDNADDDNNQLTILIDRERSKKSD